MTACAPSTRTGLLVARDEGATQTAQLAWADLDLPTRRARLSQEPELAEAAAVSAADQYAAALVSPARAGHILARPGASELAQAAALLTLDRSTGPLPADAERPVNLTPHGRPVSIAALRSASEILPLLQRGDLLLARAKAGGEKEQTAIRTWSRRVLTRAHATNAPAAATLERLRDGLAYVGARTQGRVFCGWLYAHVAELYGHEAGAEAAKLGGWTGPLSGAAEEYRNAVTVAFSDNVDQLARISALGAPHVPNIAMVLNPHTPEDLLPQLIRSNPVARGALLTRTQDPTLRRMAIARSPVLLATEPLPAEPAAEVDARRTLALRTLVDQRADRYRGTLSERHIVTFGDLRGEDLLELSAQTTLDVLDEHRARELRAVEAAACRFPNQLDVYDRLRRDSTGTAREVLQLAGDVSAPAAQS